MKQSLTRKSDASKKAQVSKLFAGICLQSQGEEIVSNFGGNFMFDLGEFQANSLLGEFAEVQK